MISTGTPLRSFTFPAGPPRRPTPGQAPGPTATRRAKAPFDANICSVAQDTEASTSQSTPPLVAVGYGPRCVPVMQLAEAAAGVCDLLWMIDTAVPGMGEMADLLNRFGPVVDLRGMSAEHAVKTLADWEPDGVTTYLDAGM